MNEKIFKSIFNLLLSYGSTKLSQSKKSIVCFTHIPDTAPIATLLPPNWEVKSNPSQYDPKTNTMGPAMTVVFSQKVQTADDAFADFSF